MAGALAEGQDLRPATNGNEIVFAPYTPPVAVIGVAEYQSLRAAIEAAQAGDTITLLRDDHVSFTSEATEIVIGKALTIDGGGHTLYGVSNYAYDGVNDHDIYISAAAGDVTIKGLKITEFSDTAPTVQQRTYPIWSSQNYAGKLTLDGVTIDKFARGAINLNGGTFEITNCVIAGYAGGVGAPANYFQNAITVKNAKGTVAETTVTGIGTHEGSQWGAGVVTFNSNGDGEVTFLSGTYTADYVIEVSSNATGKVVIQGGAFIATADAAESAFQLDEGDDATFKVELSGGWFDRAPTNAFIVAGYKVEEDVAGAPVDGAYYHVVPEAAVTKPEVDAGDGLAAYNAAHPDAPVQPITFAVPQGGQDELCTLAFVAPEAGWYFLYTSTTVAGPYSPDYTTKKQVSENDLVRLTESAAGTTKFFKIGWSETDPE